MFGFKNTFYSVLFLLSGYTRRCDGRYSGWVKLPEPARAISTHQPTWTEIKAREDMDSRHTMFMGRPKNDGKKEGKRVRDLTFLLDVNVLVYKLERQAQT